MKTRVLLCKNLPAVANRVRTALGASSEIELCGEVLPVEVLTAVAALTPHVLILDLDPPTFSPALVCNLLREPRLKVLALWPAHSRPMPEALTKGLSVGRLEIMRPPAIAPSESAEWWDRALLDTINAVAQGHWTPRGTRRTSVPPVSAAPARPPRLIGIAASTGGPPALAKILGELPADLPVPLLLAQHMTPGFVGGLVDWLSKITRLQILVAAAGVIPAPGCLYVAPDQCDVQLGPRLDLLVAPGRGPHCPWADALLLSLARELRDRAAGIVLTGMGNDGAQGLLAIRAAGGVTLAQDEASSVVFGMPKAAIAATAATHVVALDDMASAIRQMCGEKLPRPGPLDASLGSFDGEPK